jgi:uncharacterized membrane protein YbhN (UPF0104 family)
MTRWLKNLLGIVIIGLLLWYLAQHWDNLKGLVNLKLSTILCLFIVVTGGVVVGSYTIQRLIAVFGIRPGFWEMFHLHNATILLNYMPMKFGTFYRANYLKRHYGLIYAHFTVLFIYLLILMTIAAAVAGLIVLLTVYGLNRDETFLLAVILLAFLIFSVVFAFIPLPVIRGTNKLTIALRNFAQGRKMMTENKFDLCVNMLLATGCFLSSSVQLAIIYHSMGQNVHPAGYLVLGAVAYVTMFLGITPGSLGLRELALALCAVALGIDFNVGSLAAIIDRAVALVWSFTIGVASTLYLWYKFPQDFNKTEIERPLQ